VALIAETAKYLEDSNSNCANTLTIILTWDTTIVSMPQHIQHYISNFIPYVAIISSNSAHQSSSISISNRKTYLRWKIKFYDHQNLYSRKSEHVRNGTNQTENEVVVQAGYDICSSGDMRNPHDPQSCFDEYKKKLIWTIQETT